MPRAYAPPPIRTVTNPANPLTKHGHRRQARHAMRWIAAIWADALVETAAGEGVSRARLDAALAEITPPEPTPLPDQHPMDRRLLEAAHLAIWDAVMRLRDDPGLPIRFGASLSPDAYDVLGLACKTAANVDQALERLARYLHLWTNTVRCEITRHPRGARVALHREGPRDLALRSANESAVAEMTHALRSIAAGPIGPEQAHFAHDAPPSLDEHRRFFGCPLHFGSTFDGIHLSSDALATPLALADAGLSRYLLDRLEAAPAPEPPSLHRTLRRAIGDMLPEGRPTAARIAKHLSISPRTLRRRLAAESLTLVAVIADVRREVADELLASGKPIAEVAYLVGYSEPSAFHRAYKGWTGRTPRSAT